MLDLSIIIVSYNTKEFLQKCLQSVFEGSKDMSLEVIVVDNASIDNSVEMVKKEFPKVFVIENRNNLGFSKANNLGVKQAKGRYLLFFNSDTVVNKNVLKKMVDFMDENKKAGAATCRVALTDGKLDDACHRGFPTPWNSFCHFTGLSKVSLAKKIFSGYSLGWMDLKETHKIDACAGAFMIVRREAGEEIKWWDEDYFWYGEDLDFCYRLKEKGWDIYFNPYVSILHYKGVSGGIKNISKHLTTADKETKIRATYARFEAMKIFYKKHYMNKYPQILNFLVNTGINFRLWLAIRTL